MTAAQGEALPLARRPPATASLIWLLIGVIGWGAIVALASRMLATQPPTAGFDLELLLEAGRRVAAGQSPYDPALVGGAVVQAESLFYSYPPPVAQLTRLLAGVPSGVALLLWGAGATAAMVVVAVAVARRSGSSGTSSGIALPVVAVAPFVFPFAVALLFGNLDAWFPALYGLLLLGALRPGASAGAPSAAAAGVALAAASVAKLHPASLGLWFLLRGSAGRRIVAVAAVAALAIVGLSLLVGGLDPWRDYLAVVRAGAGADLLDRRNVGPAVQLGLLVGFDEATVRVAQVAVSLGALGLTAWAAVRRSDPVESLTWAAIASLVTLPVTWFHYPAAVIPFAVAAVARSQDAPSAARGRTRLLVAAAVGVSIVAIGFAPLVWLAVALVVAAVRAQRPRGPD